MIKTVLRRLRGLVGMAISWAIPWSIGLGVTGGLLVYFLPNFPPGVSRLDVAIEAAVLYGLNGAVMGFLTGGVFSMVLMAAERKRELSNLDGSRFALWGGVAGAATSLAFVLPSLAAGHSSVLVGSVIVGIAVGLGSSSAAAALKIAKSAVAIGPGPEMGGGLALPGEE